jgi:hypothetical protein
MRRAMCVLALSLLAYLSSAAAHAACLNPAISRAPAAQPGDVKATTPGSFAWLVELTGGFKRPDGYPIQLDSAEVDTRSQVAINLIVSKMATPLVAAPDKVQVEITLIKGNATKKLDHGSWSQCGNLFQGPIIDVADPNVGDKDAIQVKLTNSMTQEFATYNLKPRALGFHQQTSDSVALIQRVGVSRQDIRNGVNKINFAPSPGVSFGTIYTPRRETSGNVLSILSPGAAFVASFLDWKNNVQLTTNGTFPSRTSSSDISIGLGGQISLFEGAVAAIYGWNLQATGPRRYWGIAISFVNLYQKISDLTSGSAKGGSATTGQQSAQQRPPVQAPAQGSRSDVGSPAASAGGSGSASTGSDSKRALEAGNDGPQEQPAEAGPTDGAPEGRPPDSSANGTATGSTATNVPVKGASTPGPVHSVGDGKSTTGATIVWEVDNNFRLLKGAAQQRRFAQDLARYRCRARGTSWAYSRSGCKKDKPVHGRYPVLTTTPFSTYWDESLGAYEPDYAQVPRDWTILATATLKRRGSARMHCLWSVDGGSPAAETSCRNATLLTKTSSEVHVVVLSSSDAVLGEASLKVEPHDILIASLGDSFASGEGNPETRRPVLSRIRAHVQAPMAGWSDRRCHRSLLAGATLAAYDVAAANKHSSVTFVGFACSGASVREGVLGSYEGQETLRSMSDFAAKWDVGDDYQKVLGTLHDPLPPQIDALVEALCPAGGYDASTGRCTDEMRKPDVLLLSIGGNDIGFGKLIRSWVKKSCGNDTCRRQYREGIRAKRKRLSIDLADLGTTLGNRVGSASVLIVEYPDPTHNEKGAFCSDAAFSQTSFVPGILALTGHRLRGGDMRLAFEEVVLGLRSDLSAVAISNSAQRWRYVGGLVDASRTKGYCSSTRWFNTISDSLNKEGMPDGAMHPNFFQHSKVAEIIATSIKALLIR